MSQDLLTQLADYGEYCEDRQGSVAVDEIDLITDYVPQPDESTRPDETTTATPRRRRIGVLTAVAAAILLVVGVAVVVADRTRDDVVTDPVSVPTVADPVSPPGVAEPVPSAGVVDSLGYRWSRISSDGLRPGREMGDVTVGGPGLVGVGVVGLDDHIGAVWTSADGLTWTRVPHDEAVFGGEGDLKIWSVTAGGPGLVAVGSVEPSGYSEVWDDLGDVDAAVWTSVDGLTWSRAPHDEAVFGGEGDQGMSEVIAGGPGLVAVGGDSVGGYDFEREVWDEVGSAAVWTSVDGFTWSRVPHDEVVFGGEHVQGMSSVTLGGPGLVAVGQDGFSHDGKWGQGAGYQDATRVAAVWTSVDGIAWSRVPHDDAVFGGEGNQWMSDVTSAGSGLVAVGGDWSSAAQSAAVWTSDDAITWTRVPHDDAVFGGERVMTSVTATELGLVAGGEQGNWAAVWTSTDGLVWSAIPLPEPSSKKVWSVISAGPDVVAVGSDWPNRGAAVWVGTAEGPEG